MHCSPSGGQIGIGKSKITGRNSHSSMSAVNKKEKKNPSLSSNTKQAGLCNQRKLIILLHWCFLCFALLG